MDMDFGTALQALRGLKIQTGSLVCLGCGREHNCSTQGCAIIRDAAEHMDLAAQHYDHLNDLCDDYLQAAQTAQQELACREAAADEAYAAVCQERDALRKELEAVKAERDAAVADLGRMLDNCKVCGHADSAPEDCDCECLDCKKSAFAATAGTAADLNGGAW